MNRHIKLIEQFEDETELPATWSTGGMGGYTDEYIEWLQEKVATIDNLQTSDKQNDISPLVSVSVLSDKLKSMRYTKEQKAERTKEGLQEVFGWEICLNKMENWLKAHCTEH